MRHSRYANGQKCVFSAHTEHNAPWFSLIASLQQELNLFQGYFWNNKASAPGDYVHLFYEKPFFAITSFPIAL